MAIKKKLDFSKVPTAAAPMSMPNQSNVLGGINQNRNKFAGGPSVPNQIPANLPASPGVQGVNARDFIASRENLVNQFKSLGHTDIAARKLANTAISQQLDVQAGATPDIFGNTNQAGPAVQAGALGQARERAKSEIAGLGAAESTTPTQGQMNREGFFTAVAIGATLFSLIKGKGAAITGESKLLRTGAIAGVSTGIQRSRVSNAASQFAASKDLIDETSDAMEKGLISWSDGMSIINEQMLNINRQERFLKSVTGDFVSDWLSGGKDNLADIQKFRTDFGLFTAPRLQAIGITNQRQQLPG